MSCASSTSASTARPALQARGHPSGLAATAVPVCPCASLRVVSRLSVAQLLQFAMCGVLRRVIPVQRNARHQFCRSYAVKRPAPDPESRSDGSDGTGVVYRQASGAYECTTPAIRGRSLAGVLLSAGLCPLLGQRAGVVRSEGRGALPVARTPNRGRCFGAALRRPRQLVRRTGTAVGSAPHRAGSALEDHRAVVVLALECQVDDHRNVVARGIALAFIAVDAGIRHEVGEGM